MKIHLKMRSKILIMCLSCTLLALIIQTFLFQDISSKLIYDQAKEENYSRLENMQTDIYSFVKNIENNLIEVYSQKELIQDLKDHRPVQELRDTHHREAYNIGVNFFATSDGVLSLYLYNEEHEIISTYRRAVTPKHNYKTDIYEGEDTTNSAIVRQYAESDNTTMLVSSYYNENRERDIVRIVLKLYNNSNFQDKIGYIVCDVDSKAMQGVLEKYSADHTARMWLQPIGDRPMITSGDIEEEDESYYQELIAEIEQGTEDIQDEDYISSKRVLFHVSQNKYNINAYTLMPQDLLEQNQNTLTRNLILIAGIMIVASTFLTFNITKMIISPMERLMQTIERIKQGETELRVSIRRQDEIGELGARFNEMLDQMQQLMNQEYEARLSLSQAEYKALQAQINPHFLYNTLDTMSSIADIKDCPEVSALSQSLSSIFRYSLDMKNPFATISQEMAHLKNYIYVMDVRMQDHIRYEFDIEEAVLLNTVPRLSIQPLVENALNHGLRNIRGEKNIIIRAAAEGENLRISVEDNGVGMDADEVNRQLEQNDIDIVEEGTSIGLYNINARMKMLYGKEYGLHIESVKGNGTKVILRIPKVNMEVADTWQKPIKY